MLLFPQSRFLVCRFEQCLSQSQGWVISARWAWHGAVSMVDGEGFACSYWGRVGVGCGLGVGSRFRGSCSEFWWLRLECTAGARAASPFPCAYRVMAWGLCPLSEQQFPPFLLACFISAKHILCIHVGLHLRPLKKAPADKAGPLTRKKKTKNNS